MRSTRFARVSRRTVSQLADRDDLWKLLVCVARFKASDQRKLYNNG